MGRPDNSALPPSRVATLAAQIVTSYLISRPFATEQVPTLVRSIIDTLRELTIEPDQRPRRPDLWETYLDATRTEPKPKCVAQPGKRMGRPPNSETTRCHMCNRRFRDLPAHFHQVHGIRQTTEARPWVATP